MGADSLVADGVAVQRVSNMSADQRRHKRFKAQGEVFAAFVMPNEPIIVGKVLDVSPGGAGVQYLSTRKLETGPTSIKLFGLNSPHMEKMESTVVYDQEIPNESWSIPKVRRCGIKFERLHSQVQAKLRELRKTNPRGWNPKESFAQMSL
jgi:hypothetical protein